MAMPPLQPSPRPSPKLPRPWNAAERQAQADKVIGRQRKPHADRGERRKVQLPNSRRRRVGDRTEPEPL
jgi:hypothetical protein